MLSVIIIFVFIIGMGLLIWWSDKHEVKESQEPLSSEAQDHYFIKIVLEITDKIKNIKGGKEVKLFLQGKTEGSQSIYKSTPYSDYLASETALLGTLGALGAVLSTGAHNNRFKVEKIGEIQSMWVYYLLRQIKKDNISKEEKKKNDKDIQSKIAYLLNSKVLLLTNQNNVKDAWMIILKDKTLTTKVLNQLWGQVRQMLFPEYK